MNNNTTCGQCNKPIFKEQKVLNRLAKRNGKPFCSISCSAKFYSKKNWGNSLRDKYTPFRWFIRNLHLRNKEINIDLDYLIGLWNQQKGTCPFTGWQLILPINNNGFKLQEKRDENYKSSRHASLDRIDNSKGYIKGNVRFISVTANFAKIRLSDNELIEFCKAVASYK